MSLYVGVYVYVYIFNPLATHTSDQSIEARPNQN